jgi:hypothetical protein
VYRSTVFKTAAFDRSAISPFLLKMKDRRIRRGVYPDKSGPFLRRKDNIILFFWN